ncbi:MAG: hypothetical protein M1474_03670 [Candidatus Marsarchaeota archaeon]|jgi:hypothetical protein|nr:hypothetical protein [Candidatus Marsarchaeota archaeon]
MARELRCIVCGEKKPGLEVEDDYVIDAIRWFKTHVTRNAKNYRLVVCKACYPKYNRYRSSYIKKQVAYLVLGFVFAGLLAIVSPSKLIALGYGAAIVVFMYALSLLSYTPAVKTPAGLKPLKG